MKMKEDQDWNVVYKLVHGLYKDHTIIKHPKMFGCWCLGLLSKLVMDQGCQNTLYWPLIQHDLGVSAKGPVMDILTKQIMQKFQDIMVTGIRRTTLGKKPLKWGKVGT
jgi:hypothetical protein